MKYIKVFLFLFISSHASSQIAGYMGKRAVLSYSNYFMVGLVGPGPNNAGYMDEASLSLNNVHCLNFEYVYKQRKVVCLSGQYLRTGVAYDRGGHDGFINGASYRDYPYPGGAKYGGNYSKPALLTSTNISLGVKSFKSGCIAPVGKYNKLEMILLFEKIKYDNTNFMKSVTSDPVDDTLFTLGTGEYNYVNVAIAYTIGREHIINDKIVIDYGIRFGLTPAMNIVSLTSDDSYSTIEMYYKRYSNSRIGRQQLFNFHVGIGFLAF